MISHLYLFLLILLIFLQSVETNILFIRVKDDASKIVDYFKENNVLIGAWSANLLRIVVHRNITDENIQHVISVFKSYSFN